jgi:hypothetical protein
VEGYVEMVIREGQERETLKEELERELRRFVRLYDGQPEWLWSPETVRFVRAVRPKLLGGPVEYRPAGYPEGEGLRRLLLLLAGDCGSLREGTY